MNLEALCIRYINDQLSLLDQQLLPHKEVWVNCDKPEDMVDCIKKLKVRGAPAIGVAAALSLAKFALEGATEGRFKQAAESLRASRPTAVNLMAAIDRILSYESFDPQKISAVAVEIFNEDVELCDRIASYGDSLIEDGDQILTHCNTGGLATAGVGTALGVIRKAYENNKNIHVYVDETRPLLQGGRLTTWELEKLGIPYTLICDNMAAGLMAQGKITKAIVGADRIAVNGDFANKIGTYSVALSCNYHKVPFYMAAPYTTIDKECQSGKQIPIEERNPNEVRGVYGSFGELMWSPASSDVYNPAFDVTPAKLVSAWILDTGVYHLEDVEKGAFLK